MNSLDQARARDARDPLRPLRELYSIPPGVIYLDGNSLGPLPQAAPERIARAVTTEWGEGLIRSWNNAGWYEMPRRIGDKIATLVGAAPGELLATDTTSINLFKVLSTALSIAASHGADRRVVISERSNFPTDLYIAEALCRERGFRLQLLDAAQIPAALDAGTAVLMLTHVNYRTGAMHDMRELTRLAHAAGALAVWDLCHSAGAVEVDLRGADADFAVGCGYKYLNGGPGAPAFLWVHPRHAGEHWQPLAGWWGHQAPFAFTPQYEPAPGVARYLCGTQPIVSMTGLECGVDTFLAARELGGMAAIRQKSLALTDYFIALVEERCAGHGLELATPRAHTERGSQVCLARGEGAYAIVQALIARGVIGDFRAGRPDILRFGFTPLYLGFEDVWNAAEHLRQVMEGGEWRRPEFNRQHAVT
jgi:kynureninase